ncbi:hypothetical protein HZH68_002223 [Vespula germanica]|uniref:Uncharacterized protein n=1 Tax=Vespula germanica TaxID=30212 RepID=A0A834NM28_VESGE|nr:hypothetical protein HZH68_002223 [Vespula germanica]
MWCILSTEPSRAENVSHGGHPLCSTIGMGGCFLRNTTPNTCSLSRLENLAYRSTPLREWWNTTEGYVSTELLNHYSSRYRRGTLTSYYVDHYASPVQPPDLTL